MLLYISVYIPLIFYTSYTLRFEDVLSWWWVIRLIRVSNVRESLLCAQPAIC